jgi:heterodisulfide reductase subunit A2
LSGAAGRFSVRVIQHPRYIDTDKCIACGLCAEKCPKKVPNAYDEGLSQRKAAHVQYPQAVPLKYAIDPDHCIYLTKGKCRACEKVCPTGAIHFADQEKELTLEVGAIVLATGSQVYDPALHDVYGYQKSSDIVTGMEFERILSASGPFSGHVVRPSDGKEPKKIAWLQCIGSRDTHIGANNYCSAVCCTYAIKQAMLAKEHCKESLDAVIFYMDVRSHGKYREQYYNRSRDEFGVRFIRSRITHVRPTEDGLAHGIWYVDETGKKVAESFDMVVLSVGMGISKETLNLIQRLGVRTDPYGFAACSSFEPTRTSVPGIYVSGVLEAPKDIPRSIIQAGAAAGVAGGDLKDSRWSRTKTRAIPGEKDVRGESPRIGVFVCRCGTNIAGIVDVPAVVDYARGLPGVVYADENMFTCSQDTQDMMTQVIKDKKLNRVVVAACTPRTHEALFQETLINAGLNKYLFEMANIRNQCSWVHGQDHAQATHKAKKLLKMAVTKAALMEPLNETVLDIDPTALIVGGGVAGMVAAKTLSDQGYHAMLLEKGDYLGGQARHFHQTWQGEDVKRYLDTLIHDISSDPKIDIRLNTEIVDVKGFVGNFETKVVGNEKEEILKHGVAIVATGASELKPNQYGHGEDGRVVTGLELEQKILQKDPEIDTARCVVFLLCVGSRIKERPYCSKVCCIHSVTNALRLKASDPQREIFIVFRQMRTYGLQEDFYREAREKGIHFIRYDYKKDFHVEFQKESLEISFTDTIFKRRMKINSDLLVLASAIVPPKDPPLARMFKMTTSDDGFYEEAHVKLRPVDCITDGVFICGLALAPVPMGEAIAQAQAAAARAITVLAQKQTRVSGSVAQVSPAACTSCGICVSICPYSAPFFTQEGRFAGKAEINPVLCKGCGLCVASCRSGALNLKGFTENQIMSMIDAL